MLNLKEKDAIRNIVIQSVEDNDDVKGLYTREVEGEMIQAFKVARGNEKQADSVMVDNLTKTRLTIGINVKLDRKANAPVVYRRLFESISESLKEIKFTLSKLKMTVIDIEGE